MVAYIEENLKLFAAESEAWKPKHEAVMEGYRCADRLSDPAAHGLFILSRINALVEGIHAPESTARMTISFAEHLCRVYEMWYAAASDCLECVDASEAAGFPVDNSHALQVAHQEIGQRLRWTRTLQASIADYKQGKAIPLTQALNELQAGA